MFLFGNDYLNSISALLNGPDRPYEKILMNEKSSVPIINNPCRDNNSFLQIHVRPLNAKQQKRLLEKQSKRHYQSIKNKCLHFSFPITYPCPIKSKRQHSSDLSISSPAPSLQKPSISQLSNNLSQLKSAVSILFNDDQNNPMLKQNHSSNACTCQLCGSILSNGICSCIVQNLLQLNNRKSNDILVEFNDIFANLASNNIIT